MYGFHVDTNSKVAVYKQIISEFEGAISSEDLKTGDLLPSMNKLASELNISMETVKKAYAILRNKGLIEAQQGKGFYVTANNSKKKTSILILLDRLSTYRQETVNGFLDEIGNQVDINILIFNQSIELFEYFIDNNLGKYDYYLISPHFPQDAKTQARAVKTIKRIPFHKLILIDKALNGLQGKYGAIYQDYDNDAYNCLCQHKDAFSNTRRINIITLKNSLYGPYIQTGIERFCTENGITCTAMTQAPKKITEGEVFLLVNSQLDSGLIALVSKAREQKMTVGKDYYIISYNETPIDEVILNGLTTISTDFARMGRIAARMIKERNMQKAHNDFRMIRRVTF